MAAFGLVGCGSGGVGVLTGIDGTEGIFFSSLMLLVNIDVEGIDGREIFEDGIFLRRFRCGGLGSGTVTFGSE